MATRPTMTTRTQSRANNLVNPPEIHNTDFVGRVKSFLIGIVETDCLLSEQQLKRLSDHKYSAQDVSYLDELCMKRFWDFVVLKYPLWLAPNLITLVGLLMNVFAVLVLASFSPDAKQEAPFWTYILCGAGLFAYQTLDATDGKQARRTKSASPLGELFDHGCDSLSQVFVSLEVCLTLSLGQYRGGVVAVCALAMALFYCAHWQTYVSGTLKFARFDVTEAQMVVIITCLFTALVGPHFWKWHIFGPVNINLLLMVGCGLGAVIQGSTYLKSVWTGGVGKNGSTVADTSVLFPLAPLCGIIIPFVVIYMKSHTGVFDEHIVLYCSCFGFVAAKMTNRIIIAHMSKSPLQFVDTVMISPLLLFLNQYFDYFVNELHMLYFCTALALLNVLVHSFLVCRQFCSYLHIRCFHIPVIRE